MKWIDENVRSEPCDRSCHGIDRFCNIITVPLRLRYSTLLWGVLPVDSPPPHLSFIHLYHPQITWPGFNNSTAEAILVSRLCTSTFCWFHYFFIALFAFHNFQWDWKPQGGATVYVDKFTFQKGNAIPEVVWLRNILRIACGANTNVPEGNKFIPYPHSAMWIIRSWESILQGNGLLADWMAK